MKDTLKKKAVSFRTQGMSYSEILKKIPVAKSTLSVWLRSVGLSKPQAQRLTAKKISSIKRGWIKWMRERVRQKERIRKNASEQIGQISERELWLTGIALYWAEGTKERKRSGQGVAFSNSDPLMIKIFLIWLRKIVNVDEKDIKFELYLHKDREKEAEKIKHYWADVAGCSTGCFKYIYFKKHKTKKEHKKDVNIYYGQLKICVRKSSELNRKIAGWITGVCRQCGVV